MMTFFDGRVWQTLTLVGVFLLLSAFIAMFITRIQANKTLREHNKIVRDINELRHADATSNDILTFLMIESHATWAQRVGVVTIYWATDGSLRAKSGQRNVSGSQCKAGQNCGLYYGFHEMFELQVPEKIPACPICQKCDAQMFGLFNLETSSPSSIGENDQIAWMKNQLCSCGEISKLERAQRSVDWRTSRVNENEEK